MGRRYIPAASEYAGSSIAYDSIKALADFFWPNIELSDRYYPKTRGFKLNHSFSLPDRHYTDFCHVVARSMNQAYELDSNDDYCHPMPWRANEGLAKRLSFFDELQGGDVVIFDYNQKKIGGRKSGVVSIIGLFLFECQNHRYGYYKRLAHHCYKMDFAQHRIDQRHVHRLVQLNLVLTRLPLFLVFHILNFNEGVLHSRLLLQAENKCNHIQTQWDSGRKKQRQQRWFDASFRRLYQEHRLWRSVEALSRSNNETAIVVYHSRAQWSLGCQ